MSLSIPPHLLDNSAAALRQRMVNAVVALQPLPADIPNLAAHPVQIRHSRAKGLHLVAARDIKKGEVVLREAPPAAVVRPEWEFGSRFCQGCFAKLDEARCATWAMKDPRHNDASNELCEDCESSSRVRLLDRRTFWRDLPDNESDDEEEDVADRLSTVKVSTATDDGTEGAGALPQAPKKKDSEVLSPEDIDDSLFRFFQRVVFNWDAQLLWKYPGYVTEEPKDGQLAPPIVTSPLHILLLTSPASEHVSIEPQISTFVSLLDSHLHLVGLESQKQLLERLIRTAFHNAHEVADSAGGRSVGMGIYPVASLLNHACANAANANWAIDAGGENGGIFVATARRDVKEGEELTIEYGKFGDGEGVQLPVKLEYIMKTWRFACTCPVCSACWVCRDTKLQGLKCSGCGVAAYCSREHQKQDWPKQHREWCGYLRDLKARCE